MGSLYEAVFMVTLPRLPLLLLPVLLRLLQTQKMIDVGDGDDCDADDGIGRVAEDDDSIDHSLDDGDDDHEHVTRMTIPRIVVVIMMMAVLVVVMLMVAIVVVESSSSSSKSSDSTSAVVVLSRRRRRLCRCRGGGGGGGGVDSGRNSSRSSRKRVRAIPVAMQSFHTVQNR